MKRWIATVVSVAVTAMMFMLPAAQITKAAMPYPLVRYGDGVKLLGDAALGTEGVTLTKPLDGVAFYTDGDAVLLETSATVTLAVSVDAQYQGTVTVAADVPTAIADALTPTMHRIEIAACEAVQTVITAVHTNGSFSAVPRAPRTMVFYEAGFSAEDMMRIAHVVGMDCRLAQGDDTDGAADIVVTASADSAAVFKQRYPSARTVFTGEAPADAAYTCEAVWETVAQYVRDEVAPVSYYEALTHYVPLGAEWLATGRPTAQDAAKLELELAVAQDNGQISGVLYTLLEEMKSHPKAALIPENDGVIKRVHPLIVTAVIFGAAAVGVMTVLLFAVNRKPTIEAT